MNIYGPENNKEVKNNNYNENNSSYNKWFHLDNNYSSLIVKGAIWAFMLLLSLVGLIVVFKDKYSNKDVIIVSSKNGSYIKNNSVNLNSFEDSISEENKDFLNKYAKNEDFSVNKPESSKNTTQVPKKNVTDNNIDSNTKTFNNDFSNNDVKNNISNNETKIAQNTEQELKDSLDTLIQEVINTPNNTTTASRVDQPAVNLPNKTNNIAPITNLTKVWLVTVYSGTDLAKAKSKWIEIHSKQPSLFNNKKVYFIKTNIPGKGIYYRVSLGDTQMNNIKPSFKTSKDASNYCKYLKDNNISCFINEVDENNLDK